MNLSKYLKGDQIKNLDEETILTIISYFNKFQSDDTIKNVMNVPMGHGKSTGLEIYAKMLSESSEQGLLIVLRENSQVHELEMKLNQFKRNCALSITSDDEDVSLKYRLCGFTQFLIITHSRLLNIVNGFTNIELYNTYMKNERIVIIDERPQFINFTTFNYETLHAFINKCLTNQEHLSINDSERIKADLSRFLIHNFTETNSTLNHSCTNDFLNDCIVKMIDTEIELGNYDNANKLKHINNVLNNDNTALIMNYSNNEKGKKIIFAERINYDHLKLRYMILDGTAGITDFMYEGFNHYTIDNKINYAKRLTFHHYDIQTSKYMRSKSDKTVLHTLGRQYLTNTKNHNKSFLLCAKEDIKFFVENDYVKEKDYETDNQLPLHILNTTGKNSLNECDMLFLCNLPIMNPDYYIAHYKAFYGDDGDFSFNEGKRHSWFKSLEMEKLYTKMVIAELSQIIHRSVLRNINSDQKVTVYAAYKMYSNQIYKIHEALRNLMCKNMDHKRELLKLKGSRGTSETVNNYGESLRMLYEFGHIPNVAKLSKLKNINIAGTGDFLKRFTDFVYNQYRRNVNAEEVINEELKVYKIKINKIKSSYFIQFD